jgi:hypothetical protein
LWCRHPGVRIPSSALNFFVQDLGGLNPFGWQALTVQVQNEHINADQIRGWGQDVILHPSLKQPSKIKKGGESIKTMVAIRALFLKSIDDVEG